MTDKTYRYTETFFSPQGEGHYSGEPSAWVRFFNCNLECQGFGQKDPTDPSTYILPYKDFDLIDIKNVEDLPVWSYGCDSSYSWSKKYRHLAHNKNASEICDEIQNRMKNEHNPDGLFHHPKSGQDIHFCITGGEPMMSQPAMIAILSEFKERGNMPSYVTVETNGTRPLSDELKNFIVKNYPSGKKGVEWFWSFSPKLEYTSGEKLAKSFKAGVVKSYASISRSGQLKFVVDGTENSWVEMEERIALIKAEGCNYPVWVMPVGATLEDQERTAGDMAVEIIKRGYKVSARVHVFLFGNKIGT